MRSVSSHPFGRASEPVGGVASPGVTDVTDEVDDAHPGDGAGPALLYVPAHPVGSAPEPSFALEPRTMNDGLPAVIAFTSVPELVRQLGRFQPWAAFLPEDLRRLAVATGFERVYVDPKVYPFELRWAPAHLDQLWG